MRVAPLLALAMFLSLSPLSDPPGGPLGGQESTPSPPTEPEKSAQRHAIRLDRPFRVGQRFWQFYEGTSTDQRTITSGEDVIRDTRSEKTVSLEALVEVQEVNKTGKRLSSRLTIRKLVAGKKGEEQELLNLGTVVLSSVVEGRHRYRLAKGGALDGATREALGAALGFTHDERSEDEEFGTEEPQPVGGESSPSAKRLRETFAKTGVEFAEASVKGTMRLEGITEHQGQKCLTISGRFEVTGVEMRGMPPDLQVEESALRLELRTDYPVDVARLAVRQSTEFSLTLTAVRPATREERELRMQLSVHKTEQKRREEVE